MPAVGGFDFLLDDEGGRRLDDLSILVPELACLLRGESLLQTCPDRLLAREAPQLLPGPVDQETSAVDRGDVDGRSACSRRPLRNSSSHASPLPTAQRLFGTPPEFLSASRAADSSANRAFDVGLSAMAMIPSSEVAVRVGESLATSGVRACGLPRR